jgi:hypothetical protein
MMNRQIADRSDIRYRLALKGVQCERRAKPGRNARPFHGDNLFVFQAGLSALIVLIAAIFDSVCISVLCTPVILLIAAFNTLGVVVDEHFIQGKLEVGLIVHSCQIAGDEPD